ncbi:hypothetical protein NM688_g9104 [Phlebia brevispora]|uniref:Uncharacterized protein n=1 Tax=Phlebia brevispora TaxID=194682 RepID=A0ACC1RL81_9APHY|nr:hypothetical protein NM688_g9104 [Phlebia brevispora]
MSSQYTSSLPTLDKLGVTVSADLDAVSIAKEWISSFAQFVAARDIPGILSLIDEQTWWRDLFALTWDLRTFHGKDKVRRFLEDCFEETRFGGIEFLMAMLDRPYPDIAWILIQFNFETAVATGRGIARLIPSKEGVWRAVTISTNLEGLKGHPERVGALRNHLPSHGKWLESRRQEKQYADHDPEVIIIGGGQSGLDLAARLKHYGVDNLIIEREPRIGDQWRNRYEALCLHDTVWSDHMPYIPFPESWPVFTPAQKVCFASILPDVFQRTSTDAVLDYTISSSLIGLNSTRKP